MRLMTRCQPRAARRALAALSGRVLAAARRGCCHHGCGAGRQRGRAAEYGAQGLVGAPVAESAGVGPPVFGGPRSLDRPPERVNLPLGGEQVGLVGHPAHDLAVAASSSQTPRCSSSANRVVSSGSSAVSRSHCGSTRPWAAAGSGRPRARRSAVPARRARGCRARPPCWWPGAIRPGAKNGVTVKL
jgi:hypothetical protein